MRLLRLKPAPSHRHPSLAPSIQPADFLIFGIGDELHLGKQAPYSNAWLFQLATEERHGDISI
jgi:hypothetical protein